MSIRVALHHETRYRYDRRVTPSAHVVRLRPAPHTRTPILAYSLRVHPTEHFLNWQQDPFGNYEARIVFQKPAAELLFEVDLVAEMTVVNPFDFFLEDGAEHFPLVYSPALRKDLTPYLQTTNVGPRFAEFVERAKGQLARAGRRMVDVLVDVNQQVHRTLRYDIRMEPGVFPPDESLERGHGSCRDFAWLLVQTLRHLGLASRFVSGYSVQLKADEKPVRGAAGVPEDSADLHAWAEVFLPGAGWVGLDATSGLLAGEGHIPLAATPDPDTAAAVTGSFGWQKRSDDDKVHEELTFAMSVRRIAESPRVSLPYSDSTWAKIESLGHEVDRILAAGDVRLTMGGEPTFVAANDPEAGEWNFDALGPTKLRYARDLLKRLHGRFAPQGLVHDGQGKWYPGEPLPRWALSCYWRKDGEPIWRDKELLALGDTGAETSADASAFITTLCEELGVEPRFAIAGYEDAWYYLWRERRLPVNTDPHDARLDDEIERARLARIFEQGLASIVGYALPLRSVVVDGRPQWQSGPWSLRSERLYLMPGDSPMGYRLPIDSLPWVSPEEHPHLYPPDPFAPREPLPRPSADRAPAPARFLSQTRPSVPGPAGDGRAHDPSAAGGRSAAFVGSEGPIARDPSASGVVRTALCVEPRQGVIHVFMPPIGAVEDYLELCARIESTAARLGKPVRIEGYLPPADPRLTRFQITPDPGVIEVNVQPAASWAEQVENTTVIYDEAREADLRAEKFMLDGRHSGTGGGNHVVLGGATPADSPALRRPHLLRSLVSYWLNHPSLSYLFSGLFVGPTSQAPRVDEARNDSLYELQIAFDELERTGSRAYPVPLWLVDRLFRNLLIDVSGNTHRTEFCIDKLYSPDGSAGRLGLVELRAFEMPPHPRMNLAQQLLVKALVAAFWDKPYERNVIAWGNELHDRFMLPHFVREDFEDVIEDMNRAGLPFDPAWFAPHHEFRFPLIGSIEARGGVVVELRQAMEPWNVLGEEATAGGTSRYVDSSVERLEVKVRGMVDGRHVVACNGRRVPLHPTGTNGERVAGVRYRAWQPPSALHPTIGVHSPLVFDVIDSWNDRAIAGCRYHVSHPGGLAFATLPRNGLEAESRRAVRFHGFGHTPGSQGVPRPEPNAEFPLTLDLRRGREGAHSAGPTR
ncbi:MAG TPA: transglutaminase family protein [Polyangiaceae bacterium]